MVKGNPQSPVPRTLLEHVPLPDGAFGSLLFQRGVTGTDFLQTVAVR